MAKGSGKKPTPPYRPTSEGIVRTAKGSKPPSGKRSGKSKEK